MLLVASIIVPLSASFAETRALRQGASVNGRVKPGSPDEIALAAREGDFVRGRLETEGGGVTLDLVDATGAHVRGLSTPGDAARDFMFVAGREGAPRLRLSAGTSAGDYTLSISAIVERAAQVPPAVSFLSPRLSRLAESLATGTSTDIFWNEIARSGTPLVEPGSNSDTRIVTFLWRGAERNVRLFGAPSSDHDWMERLAGSDVSFRSYELPSTTRLSYKLAPDIPDIPGPAGERRRALLATAQADPLNKMPWPADAADKFNQESVLELPDAPLQPWIEDRGLPKGRLTTHRFASRILGNERDVLIYMPAGSDSTNPPQGLLVLFDAAPYLDKVPTPRILDNLIADKTIPSIAAVLIGNPSPETRGRELPCNADFASFLATELMPWVRERIGTSVTADRTIVAGSSYGGLASAYAAHRHPEVFGNVLSMSGSFWWHPASGDVEAEWLTRELAKAPLRPIRWHVSAGLFETGRDEPGILETTRHLRDVLTAKGYRVAYRDYAAGHDYIAWRNALVDGLAALLGRP